MPEAADKDSKTEEPTEKRTRDAIEQGNVPFSREASKFASLVGMLAVASLFAAGNTTSLRLSLQRFFDSPGAWPLESSADVVNLFSLLAWQMAAVLLPVVGILAAAGIASSLLQNPIQLVSDRIQPDLKRISIGAAGSGCSARRGRWNSPRRFCACWPSASSPTCCSGIPRRTS